MPAPEPELGLVATEELVNELTKRFEALVITTLQDTTKEVTVRDCRFHGNLFTCIGLVDVLREELKDLVVYKEEI